MVKSIFRRGMLSLAPAALAALVGCHSASRGPAIGWQRTPRCVSCETPASYVPEQSPLPSESLPTDDEAHAAPSPPQAKTAPEPRNKTLFGRLSKESASQRNARATSRPAAPLERTPDSSESDQPQNESSENSDSLPEDDADTRPNQPEARSSNAISFEDLEAEMNPRREEVPVDRDAFGLTEAPAAALDSENRTGGDADRPATTLPPAVSERPVATSPLPAAPDEIEPWPYRVAPRATQEPDSPSPSNDEPPLYPHAPAAVQPAGRELPRVEGQWSTMSPTTPPDPAKKWLDQGRIQGLFPLPTIQPGPVRKSP